MPPVAPFQLLRRVCVAAVALACGAPLSAQFVMPVGYTATPGQGQAQGGSFNYFDDTGAQLTDQVFGVNDWTANLGNGNAYEWIGWITVTPTITFNFSGSFRITAVTIGLSRAESAGIYLPPNITIGSETFALASNAFPDQTRKDITFDFAQPYFGNQLAVTFGGNTGRWTFVDEMQIAGLAIPEPSTAILLAFGAVAFGWHCRRTRQRKTLPHE